MESSDLSLLPIFIKDESGNYQMQIGLQRSVLIDGADLHPPSKITTQLH